MTLVYYATHLLTMYPLVTDALPECLLLATILHPQAYLPHSSALKSSKAKSARLIEAEAASCKVDDGSAMPMKHCMDLPTRIVTSGMI